VISTFSPSHGRGWAGQRAGAGVDDRDPAVAQQREVRLGRGVLPHVVVHRGRDEHRAAGGQRGAGEQVVGQPVGELGDGVGRGRRDQVGVGVAHELQVGGRVVARWLLIGKRAPGGVALELVGEDRGAGQRREGRGADEPLRRGRLDRPDGMTGLGGQAHDFQRLVGGDAPTDAEQEARHTAP
jgi:hypothetical protein